MKSFTGKKVFLTRSTEENAELNRMLSNFGFQVESIPLVEISPDYSNDHLEVLEPMMPQFDGFIFISVNAAMHGLSLLQQHRSVLKSDRKIIAVGPRTAKELNTVFDTVLCPDNGVGAYSLMAADEMQAVDQLNFLILRGRHGNPWLGDELKKRQANVEYYDCYVRRRPRHLQKELTSRFTEKMFDVCFLHSAHAVVHLMESSGRLGQKIAHSAAIVGSNAVKNALIDYGWKGDIAVAKTPSSTDMLKCLMTSGVID